MAAVATGNAECGSLYILPQLSEESDFICVNCLHMKDQLEKVLFKLKSAELIIEILQKERELNKMEEGRPSHQIAETKVQLQDALSHCVLNDQCYHSEKRGQPIQLSLMAASHAVSKITSPRRELFSLQMKKEAQLVL
jgi:predicted DsbA family dithiol-disulfide isomerase